VQIYFRDGAEKQARELLADGVREYLAVDTGLRDAEVRYGLVREGPWHAIVLISADLVRPRLARVLKSKLALLQDPNLSTTKPFPATKLFAMPLLEESTAAMRLLPRLLRGKQPQDRDQSSIMLAEEVHDS